MMNSSVRPVCSLKHTASADRALTAIDVACSDCARMAAAVHEPRVRLEIPDGSSAECERQDPALEPVRAVFDAAAYGAPSARNRSDFSSCSGKGLGGSSAMNFLMWTRPQREDVDGKFPYRPTTNSP